MTFNTIKYTLKVWITSVLFAPVLFILLSAIINQLGFKSVLKSIPAEVMVYIAYVAFELVLSSVTWILFWLITVLWALIPFEPVVRKWFIFLTGLILTIGTFMATLLHSNFFDIHNNDVILMLANCFCIGFGVWYFKLKLDFGVLGYD
jgi:hypothetical protein